MAGGAGQVAGERDVACRHSGPVLSTLHVFTLFILFQTPVRVPWCICVRVKILGFLVLLCHCSGCWGWNPALPSPESPSRMLFSPPAKDLFGLQRSPSLSGAVSHLANGRGTCW